MIPTINELTTELYEEEYYDRTHKVNIQQDVVQGFTDGREALEQTIYFILGTERYQFPIYSWDYGIELVDLYGMPITYVKPEIKRRVYEALIQDDRITDVTDFQFEENRNNLYVTFTCHTTINTSIQAGIEVNI